MTVSEIALESRSCLSSLIYSEFAFKRALQNKLLFDISILTEICWDVTGSLCDALWKYESSISMAIYVSKSQFLCPYTSVVKNNEVKKVIFHNRLPF